MVVNLFTMQCQLVSNGHMSEDYSIRMDNWKYLPSFWKSRFDKAEVLDNLSFVRDVALFNSEQKYFISFLIFIYFPFVY